MPGHDINKGFVVYPTYRIVGDKAYVYLYGRLESGDAFLTINAYRPYFQIKKSDLEKAKSATSRKFATEDAGFKDFRGHELIKVILDIPGDVPQLRKELEDRDIICYEADVRFAIRFMIDHGIKGYISISGEPVKEGNLLVFRECAIGPAADAQVKLKVLSIDIETRPDLSELYCISLVCDDFKKVLIKSHDDRLQNAFVYPDEKTLLEAFKDYVQLLDPDIITGWNVIDFDFAFLDKCFKKHKVPFDLARNKERCKLQIEESFMRESKADLPGRVVLDGIHLLKMSFVKVEDMKLGTVAHTLLGETKLIEEKNKAQDIIDAYENDQQKLVDYNMKDSDLVLRIIEKLDLINLTVQRSTITGMPVDRVKASVASLDSMYLREARKRKIACYSIRGSDKEESVKGAFVFDSKPGLYDYVIVLDFKSLYPSIIQTFNIDPLTLDSKGEIESPTGARYLREPQGILGHIIEDIMRQREVVRKKDPVKSYALKITMNSMWGAIANTSCRFYSNEMANSITSFARYVIQLTAKKLEELGYHQIYGDTDSIFLDSHAKSYDKAEAIGVKIQSYVNDFFAKEIQERYHRENRLFLEFDKVYRVFLMPNVRGTDKGAKKRYAGILCKKKDGKVVEELNFVGMEVMRGDWTDLAKKFQVELFGKVFRKEPYESYLRTFVADLKAGKMDDLVVYRKSISKPLSAYTKTTPPHVKAARLLGPDFKGSIIKYVMTAKGPEPLELLSSPPDYQHYVDKQLKPIAESVLSFFGKDFDEIINKQRSLSDY